MKLQLDGTRKKSLSMKKLKRDYFEIRVCAKLMSSMSKAKGRHDFILTCLGNAIFSSGIWEGFLLIKFVLKGSRTSQLVIISEMN